MKSQLELKVSEATIEMKTKHQEQEVAHRQEIQKLEKDVKDSRLKAVKHEECDVKERLSNVIKSEVNKNDRSLQELLEKQREEAQVLKKQLGDL